jgi:rhamnosyl/mannosyltransferase
MEANMIAAKQASQHRLVTWVPDRPLRVCHLAKFYPPATGGIETHLQTLGRAQSRLGAEVRVVSVNHQDRAGQDVTWKALARTETVEEDDGPVVVRRVGRWASLFRLEVCPGLVGLGQRLREWQTDVVHLHVPNPTMLLALAASRTSLPVVVTYHSDVVRQKKLGLALWPFENVVFRRSAAVLASSPPYADSSPLLQRYAGQVRVVPFGIDLAPFLRPGPAARQQARRLRERHGSPLWLSVGRLVYYKGLFTALEALRHVPGRLVVIGEGPLAGDLTRRSRELGVADRVILRGRVEADELIGAYHAATALWFPSSARSEAFGLVQVEAMASGCPVINTDIPGSGVPWVSRHEESGLTIPVGDAGALARAARRLLDEPGLRERLARRARKRACREFDADTMASRTLEVYRSVLRASAPDRPSLSATFDRRFEVASSATEAGQ